MSEPVWTDVWSSVAFRRKLIGLRAAGGRVLLRLPYGAVAAFEAAEAEEFYRHFGDALEKAREQLGTRADDSAASSKSSDARVFKFPG